MVDPDPEGESGKKSCIFRSLKLESESKDHRDDLEN